MAQPPRIAILAYIDIAYGMGATRRVTMIAEGLRRAGMDVHLLGAIGAGTGQAQIRLASAGVQPETPPRIRSILQAIQRRREAFGQLMTLLKSGLDWLFLYNIGADGIPFARAAKWHGCRLVTDNCDVRRGGGLCHPRQLLEALSYEVGDMCIRSWADLNIVVSHHLREAVLRSAPKVPVHMLPALIDTSSFRTVPERRTKFRQDWSLGDSTLIVYLGGTQRFEGLGDLLAAARLLLARERRFRLVVAGEMIRSPFHDDLPKLAKENGLEGCILLPGRLDLPGVLGALAAADILVLPKRYDRANIAGFPQKLTEYLAAGRPVVATKVGDVALYLKDGDTALLCEPDSPISLADAIERVLENPALASHLARGARETAVRYFDSSTQGQALSQKLVDLQRRPVGAAPTC